MTRRTLALLVAAGATLAVLVLVVFPTRSYLGERSNLSDVTHQLQSLNSQNRQLAGQINKLNTDGEVERLARQQYGLVMPGEEAYAILPGALAKSGVPKSGPAKTAPAGDKSGAKHPTDAPSGPRPLSTGHQSAAGAGHPGLWDRFLDQLAFWR